jgi:hypothetical protein
MIKTAIGILILVAVAVGNECDPKYSVSNAYNFDLSSGGNFQNDPNIARLSNLAPTPNGYTQVYKNAQYASIDFSGYLQWSLLPKYDTNLCATQCQNVTGCLSFNIYVERDPTQTPGEDCPNPSAVSTVKCVLFDTILTPQTLVNAGQYRSDFEVAIAGSNGYVHTSGSATNGGSSLSVASTASSLGGVNKGASGASGGNTPGSSSTGTTGGSNTLPSTASNTGGVSSKSTAGVSSNASSGKSGTSASVASTSILSKSSSSSSSSKLSITTSAKPSTVTTAPKTSSTAASKKGKGGFDVVSFVLGLLGLY